MAFGDKDDKTEEPTAKRKSDARQEGNIPRSQDLVGWGALLAGLFMVENTVKKSANFLNQEMTRMGDLIADPDQGKALSFMVESIARSFVVIAPLLITLLILGIVGHLAQVRFVFSKKALKPKFQMLNPITGAKRLFSMQSTFELIKQLFKLGVICIVAYLTLYMAYKDLTNGGPYSIGALIGMTVAPVMSFIKYAALAGFVIGIADYMYNRKRIGKTLKMTKQEVKDEAKNSDLPPEVKGKIKQKQREMSRNRMMAAINDADVVVVNPVHIALALKYDPSRGAPRVVAKGAGFVAEKIKEKAEEGRVPIVQDIPLARALHKACDIDDEIPWQMFEAVAMVLAFVFGLKNRGSAAGFHKMPGTPDLEEADRLEAEEKKLISAK